MSSFHDSMDYSQMFSSNSSFFVDPVDKCGARKCKPKPTESIGFKNYFKMFLCRFPDMEKCQAIRKARCTYSNLTERSKQKYRDLGPDFRCCVRRRAQPKKQCKKPKRKARKCPPKPCPPKPCPPRPPCGPVCEIKDESITALVTLLLDYLKAKAAQDN